MITTGTFYDYARDDFKLKIAAGEKGLNNPALWLYLAEDEGSFGFIRGGELAVTTGMSISGTDGLRGFISALIEKQASGLIINTGKYLTCEDITDDIKDLCNKNAFLLLTMPWEMHLSDLIQTFANLHFSEKLKEDNLKLALNELCHNREAGERHREVLQANELMKGDTYAIGLLEWENSSKSMLYSILRDSRRVLAVEGEDSGGPLILLFHNMDKNSLQQQLDKIIQKAHGAGLNITIGIGSLSVGYEELCKSCMLAEKALTLAKNKKIPAFSYENAGILSLFMLNNTKEVKAFAENMLSPLIEYDRLHNTDLVKTLGDYIKYKGSLKAVADNTACHRNTVAYRVAKIKQLLNNELEDGDYVAQLSVGISGMEYAKCMTE